MIDNYYTSRRSQLIRDFDKRAKRLKRVLVSNYGDELADIITRETRQEFESLIPELPYIGGKKNQLTENLIGAAELLALYNVLKARGKRVEEVGKIAYEMAQEYCSGFFTELKLGLFRWFLFTRVGKDFLKKWALESQERRYPEDWGFSYVEGDGEEFDFGVDYTECGICKFFHSQGADEFTPFVCLFDFPHSKVSGTGLVRTMTLAEGFEKCDFRFKKGREPMNKQKTRIDSTD